MIDSERILRSVPVGLWVARVPSGELIYSNPEFERIMSVQAVGGVDIAAAPDVYAIFDREGKLYPVARLPFSRVVASGAACVVDDIVIHRRDGKKVNVRAFGRPVHDDGERLTHVVVAFVDITEEIKANVERKETEARLALAINHAPIAIWAAGNDGVITVSEGAGLEALGVASGQLVGTNIFDLYADHPTIPGYLRRGLQGESFWYTVEVGQAVYDTWLTAIRDAGGAVTGVAGLSNDVTEVRRLQSSAIQSDRIIAMGTLAATVAHEINNPLTYMLGHAEELRSSVEQLRAMTGAVDPHVRADFTRVLDDIADALEPVQSGTERIASITRELRSFGRSDAKTAEPIDLRGAVESVLRLVRKEVEAHARLVVDLQATGPVLGDRVRLVQVVLNLVVNAVHAVTDGSVDAHLITVSTQSAGSDVVVEVSDTGPGVPVAERELIFAPFVSGIAIGEGTGLGLFVSRNIVRGMGGDIIVADRDGGGAVFRVRLPVADGAVAADQPVAVHEPQLAPSAGLATVLVIDDEPYVARTLCAQLIAAGYQAEIEHDSERALARLLSDTGELDLVYCDLMMRGVSGMDLADALAVQRPSMLNRVVFMTGGAFTPRGRAFLEAHAGRCVNKPFAIVEETRRRLRALQG